MDRLKTIQEQIAALKEAKAELLEARVSEVADFYGTSNTPLESGMEKAPTKKLTNSTSIANQMLPSESTPNGFIRVCLLAFLTLFFQVFFFAVSYIIFK